MITATVDFTLEQGQEVYLTNKGNQEGKIISRRVRNEVAEYLIKPTNAGSRAANFWEREENLSGRFFFVYDVSTGIQALSEVFYCVLDAIDAEEDFCYDMLEVGQEAPHLEVWEVDSNGDKVKKIILL